MNASIEQMAAGLGASDVRYLNARKLLFVQNGVTVNMTLGDELSYLDVKIIRLFPIGQPDRFLSIRSNDNEEIGILRDAGDLDSNSRHVFAEALQRRYVVPVVKRVLAVKERFDVFDWRVETNLGYRTFTIRNLRDNIEQPAPNRYLLTDVDGNRYDVASMEELDEVSRAFLWRYI